MEVGLLSNCGAQHGWKSEQSALKSATQSLVTERANHTLSNLPAAAVASFDEDFTQRKMPSNTAATVSSTLSTVSNESDQQQRTDEGRHGNVDAGGNVHINMSESLQLQCSLSDLQLCLGLGLSANPALISPAAVTDSFTRYIRPNNILHTRDLDYSFSTTQPKILGFSGDFFQSKSTRFEHKGDDENADTLHSNVDDDSLFDLTEKGQLEDLNESVSMAPMDSSSSRLSDDNYPFALLEGQTLDSMSLSDIGRLGVKEAQILLRNSMLQDSRLINSGNGSRYGDYSEGDDDLPLDGSMRFSPMNSATSILHSTDYKASSDQSSDSSSMNELSSLAFNTPNTRNNYFLAFQDLQQSSCAASPSSLYSAAKLGNNTRSLNSQDSDIALLESKNSKKEGKLDDSGTVCSSASDQDGCAGPADFPVGTLSHSQSGSNTSDSEKGCTNRHVEDFEIRQSSGSTNSGKLRCWTDVMESYEEATVPVTLDLENQQKEESIITSLNGIDRKYRSSSSPKSIPGSRAVSTAVLSEQASCSRSDDYTSGYSSSRSVTASGNGLPHRPQLLRPSQRIRQSPSLPLNVKMTIDDLGYQDPQPVQDVATQSGSSGIAYNSPFSKHSAPSLNFLNSNGDIPENLQRCTFRLAQTARVADDETAKNPKMPRPFSCPERFLPSPERGTDYAPLRMNPVHDWESLKILLPEQLQRAFRVPLESRGSNDMHNASEMPFIRAPSVPWGIHPEEEESPRARSNSQDSQNVCPTCFKMQLQQNSHVPESVMSKSMYCDCSPSSSASCTGSNDSDSASCQEESSVFSSSSAQYPQEPHHRRGTVFDDLMQFSKQSDRSPPQLIINLKHKQEMVTALKAAAIGWLGLVGFRGMRNAHSESLARVISRQFTTSLARLLEDGLQPGLTVWSAIVCSLSSDSSGQFHRPMLMINRDTSLITADERFHSFATELLRLGQLTHWLTELVSKNSSRLRSCYSLDAFIFLANSVTKDLWDDLLDTLNCLTQVGNSSIKLVHQPPLTTNPTPPVLNTRPSHSKRSADAGSPMAKTPTSLSTSVKRLVSKLGLSSGREVPLLPTQPKLLQNKMKSSVPETDALIVHDQPARDRGRNTTVPAEPLRKDISHRNSHRSDIDFRQLSNLNQPHLAMHMKTRWSEWQLSKLTERDSPASERIEGENHNYGHLKPAYAEVNCTVGGGTVKARKAGKSPSMFDIRSFIS